MLCVVCGIGFLITVYAAGYMKGEAGYFRFFAFLGLFIFMSVAGTILFGAVFPATELLSTRAETAVNIDETSLHDSPRSASSTQLPAFHN